MPTACEPAPARTTVTGGTGPDSIGTGRGRDSVNALDGERDVVHCGKGRDRVEADEIDRVRRLRDPRVAAL